MLIQMFKDFLADIAQCDREYRWYRENEPWRYQPYKDPDCPINWSDDERRRRHGRTTRTSQ